MAACNNFCRQTSRIFSCRGSFNATRNIGPRAWLSLNPNWTFYIINRRDYSVITVNRNGSTQNLLQRQLQICRHINDGQNYVSDDFRDSYGSSVDRHVSLGEKSGQAIELKPSDEKLEVNLGDENQLDLDENHKFRPRTALILTKVSRYQFEREQLCGRSTIGEDKTKELPETEFRQILEKRGSDYTLIKYHHNVHKAVEEKLVQAFESRGVEVKRCQRFDYTDSLIEWADVVVTAGGDGTFLLGASKIRNRKKTIIGVNTDPTRSEGHLCIAKHWSLNVDDAIQALFDGKFRWIYRRRLRLTMIGEHDKIYSPAMELHNRQLQYPEYRYLDSSDHEFLREQGALHDNSDEGKYQEWPINKASTANVEIRGKQIREGGKLPSRTLPILALNEVYVGECLSSRVSYLLVKLDNDPTFIKTRNSGLIVSTGTGSTSWTYNVNKLTQQSVEALLRIIFETTGQQINFKDSAIIESVTNRFNNDLRFNPELNVMTYTIRDPISMGLTSSSSSSSPGMDLEGYSGRKPRGKASRIDVKSKCFDAHLVIDGSLSYKFDDGTQAIIEIKDEDALKTMQLGVDSK